MEADLQVTPRELPQPSAVKILSHPPEGSWAINTKSVYHCELSSFQNYEGKKRSVGDVQITKFVVFSQVSKTDSDPCVQPVLRFTLQSSLLLARLRALLESQEH